MPEKKVCFTGNLLHPPPHEYQMAAPLLYAMSLNSDNSYYMYSISWDPACPWEIIIKGGSVLFSTLSMTIAFYVNIILPVDAQLKWTLDNAQGKDWLEDLSSKRSSPCSKKVYMVIY